MTELNLRATTLNHTTWQYTVIDTASSPPGSKSEGDRYLISSSPSGDWSGKANNIATWYNNSWTYDIPKTSMYVHDNDSNLLLKYDGSSFIPAATYKSATQPEVKTNGTLWYSTTDKMLFVYDNSRSKWLSVDRRTIDFTRSGTPDGAYIRADGDANCSSTFGYLLRYPSVMIGYIYSIVTGDTTKQMDISYYSDATTPATLSISLQSATYREDFSSSINYNVHNGKPISGFVNAAGTTVTNPVFEIWLAYRPSNV